MVSLFAFLLSGAMALPEQIYISCVCRALFLGALDLYIAACVACATSLFLAQYYGRPQ
jgi:hypothetical protein